MSIPAIIHQVWFGDEMPPDIQRMTETVREKHTSHPWSYILWREHLIESALGINVADMRATWGSWAAISNVIRLNVLAKFGGVYLDTDFVCHKSLQNFSAFGLNNPGRALAAMQDEPRICNAFLAAPPNHPWIKRMLESVDQYCGNGAEWGVSLATKSASDDVALVPRHLAYPYLWNEPPEKRVPHPESILEHKWLKGWE